MSLLTNPLQSGLLLQQAVLPYTFTTGELDSLKAKLQAAENQMMQTPNKQASMLPMSAAEIRTLLRMIDMTYLQGLSGSGHYVQDCTGAASMTPMLHNQHQGINGGLPSTLNGALSTLNANTLNTGIPNTSQLVGSNGNNGNNGIGGTSNGQSLKNPPPANYICHKCNIQGHWIQECPLNTQQQQDYTKPPPANYICHRCGVPGHWIKNCPTNGNPTFDNKPHLKVIKNNENGQQSVNQQQGQSVTDNTSNNNVNATDNTSNSNVTTAQPPSKKRRLNQM